MRLATFVSNGAPLPAVVAGDDTLVPLSDLIAGAPVDMIGLIAAGPAVWQELKTAAASAGGGAPLEGARLLAPIPNPRGDIFAVGWNYLEHLQEGVGMRGPQDNTTEIPEYPALFSKRAETVVGPEAPVRHSAPASEQLDWEVELALIIGREGRDISEEDALDHVFGYTIANDVSVRDIQRRHGGQWFHGKNFDTHLPMGPWIITPDELGDADRLHIELRVNGAVKQDSNTSYMVFKVPRIIKEFSEGIVLRPGDMIITGTPSGVGFARKPPEFLKTGDVMECEIEKIGVLRNTVAAYKPD